MAEFKVIDVIDGDTFDVSPQWQWNGQTGSRVRPAGYDAPELGAYGWQSAKAKLEKLVLGQKVEQNFQAWLVAKSLTPQQAQYLSLVKNRGIARGKLELDDLFRPPLSILNAAELGVELFGEKGLKEIIQDMNDAVFKTAA